MSNFIRRTKNPVNGQFEDATWLDDWFEQHSYGVLFPSTGNIHRADDYEWEFQPSPDPGEAP